MADTAGGDRAIWEALSGPLARGSDLPLGAQLAWRLRTLIAAGALPQGARLPSARELSGAVGVNVNTVLSVYGRLESEQLIETEHGRGSFVRARPAGAAEMSALAEETAAAARAAGVDLQAVAMALLSAPATAAAADAVVRGGLGAGAPASSIETPSAIETSSAIETPSGIEPDERGERRRLRDEIAALELELARLWPLSGATSAPGHGDQPRMLDAGALRAVRDRLLVSLEAARAEAEARRSEVLHRRAGVATNTLDRRQDDESSSRRAAAVVVTWTPAWSGA